MLGQIRGKFTTLPIPGESVTLNHADLLSQAKEEQQNLKDKLREMLKETGIPRTGQVRIKRLQMQLPMFQRYLHLGIFVG